MRFGESSGNVRAVTPKPDSSAGDSGLQPVRGRTRDSDYRLQRAGGISAVEAAPPLDNADIAAYDAKLSAIRERFNGQLPEEYADLRLGDHITSEHLRQFMDLDKIIASSDRLTQVDFEKLRGVFVDIKPKPGRGIEQTTVYHRFSDDELASMKEAFASGQQVLIGREAKGGSSIAFAPEDYDQGSPSQVSRQHLGMVMMDGTVYVTDMSTNHGVHMVYEKEQPAGAEGPDAGMAAERAEELAAEEWMKWETAPTEKARVAGDDAARALGQAIDARAQSPADANRLNSWINSGEMVGSASHMQIREAIQKLRELEITGSNPALVEMTERRVDAIVHDMEKAVNPHMDKARVSQGKLREWEAMCLQGDPGIQKLKRFIEQYRTVLSEINKASKPEELFLPANMVTRDNGIQEEFKRVQEKAESTGIQRERIQMVESYKRWLEDAVRKIGKLPGIAE